MAGKRNWGRHVEAWWPADPTVYDPKGRRGGPYRPFVPPVIAKLPIALSPETADAVREATVRLAHLQTVGSAVGGLHSLSETLLRSESVASSRIEGVQMSHARLARVRHGGGREDKSAREVLGHIAALQTAIAAGATAKHVSPGVMCAIHAALIGIELDGAGRPLAGQLRETQNWIGGNDYSPLGAAFVPPPAGEVRGLLEDLGQFIDRGDVPGIAHAAIAHAQFETIHPFIDGNGRTGRALVYAILRRHRDVVEYVPPISLVLLGAPRTYVEGLTEYRDGHLEPIISLFSTAAIRACEEAELLGEEVEHLRHQWDARLSGVRSHATARLVLDVLASTPVITVAEAASKTGRSLRTTRAGIETLVEAKILKPLNARKWGRSWEALELFALVERFERRVSGTSPTRERAAAAPAASKVEPGMALSVERDYRAQATRRDTRGYSR